MITYTRLHFGLWPFRVRKDGIIEGRKCLREEGWENWTGKGPKLQTLRSNDLKKKVWTGTLWCDKVIYHRNMTRGRWTRRMPSKLLLERILQARTHGNLGPPCSGIPNRVQSTGVLLRLLIGAQVDKAFSRRRRTQLLCILYILPLQEHFSSFFPCEHWPCSVLVGCNSEVFAPCVGSKLELIYSGRRVR